MSNYFILYYKLQEKLKTINLINCKGDVLKTFARIATLNNN